MKTQNSWNSFPNSYLLTTLLSVISFNFCSCSCRFTLLSGFCIFVSCLHKNGFQPYLCILITLGVVAGGYFFSSEALHCQRSSLSLTNEKPNNDLYKQPRLGRWLSQNYLLHKHKNLSSYPCKSPGTISAHVVMPAPGRQRINAPRLSERPCLKT